MLLATLVFGASSGVQSTSKAYSGLGEPLAKVYRKLGDWDRDGFSSLLGGGDCDDFDAAVNPRAAEIPDDGIDNNCSGGDLSLAAESHDVRFAPVPASVPDDLNVILITIDTVRADHFGAYGYSRDTTPNLDQLANEGSLFANAWAHAPSTRYSVPAILTGRYPLNVRYTEIPGQWPGLSEDNQTIAEVLQSRGLYGGAILNYWYFDTQRKMNQGFAHYDNSNKRLHRAAGDKGPAKTRGSSSRQQTDIALQFIEDNRERRFFLWVHYYDPHYDYELHSEVPSFGSAEIDKYDNEIRFTDHHIGRLLDGLKQRNLYDKTAIVVTGDHGEGFGEHDINFHGYHLYAAQTRVPLLARVPGVEPQRVTTPAGHVDLLPTLANLVGASPHGDMMGRSLLGLMTGHESPDVDRFVFQQLSYENNNEYRGAASKKCHVLYNVSPSTSWELYHLESDPQEEHNRIDSAGECEDARPALEAWYDRSEVPADAVDALLAAPPAIATPLNIAFGESLQLLEVDLPSEVSRGKSFDATFTWTSRGSIPAGWKIFGHYEGPGRFTGDHKPARPFEWWKDGQYIRYKHTVVVPKNVKTGKYTLWMGVFKGDARMTAKAKGTSIRDNRVDVGQIQVVP
jgi:arylsulfatase A-like enzyme